MIAMREPIIDRLREKYRAYRAETLPHVDNGTRDVLIPESDAPEIPVGVTDAIPESRQAMYRAEIQALLSEQKALDGMNKPSTRQIDLLNIISAEKNGALRELFESHRDAKSEPQLQERPFIPLHDVRLEHAGTVRQRQFHAGGARYLMANTEDDQKSGGMGTIRLGLDRKTGRIVVLKRIFDQTFGNPNKVIELEGKVLAKVNGAPGFVQALDLVQDETDGVMLVMERVNGPELKDLIFSNQRLSELQIQTILQKLHESLTYLRIHRIAHQDIKPRNILITFEDEKTNLPILPKSSFSDRPIRNVQIADFGLASPVLEGMDYEPHPGSAIGTPMYFPPEILRISGASSLEEKLQLIPRADVFLLAVFCLEMYTHTAFFAEYVKAYRNLWQQHIFTPTDDLEPTEPWTHPREIYDVVVQEVLRIAKTYGLPKDLTPILAKALKHDPQDRYSETGSFLFDLTHPQTFVPEKRGDLEMRDPLQILRQVFAGTLNIPPQQR